MQTSLFSTMAYIEQDHDVLAELRSLLVDLEKTLGAVTSAIAEVKRLHKDATPGQVATTFSTASLSFGAAANTLRLAARTSGRVLTSAAAHEIPVDSFIPVPSDAAPKPPAVDACGK